MATSSSTPSPMADALYDLVLDAEGLKRVIEGAPSRSVVDVFVAQPASGPTWSLTNWRNSVDFVAQTRGCRRKRDR